MKKSILYLSSLIAVAGIMFLFTTCDNPDRKTELSIEDITESGTSRTVQFKFGDLGSGEFGAYGVCYSSLNHEPKVGTDSCKQHGTNPVAGESYYVTISNLNGGTTYYVRAYVQIGTGNTYKYSAVESFKTDTTAPSVTTNTVTSPKSTSAVCGGNVLSDGGAQVTARGVCYSKFNQTPTLSDQVTANGSGTGAYSSPLTGLDSNTTYYVRAYATNSVGTSYGNLQTFMTSSVLKVTTKIVTGITKNSAVSGGYVLSDGGSTVIARGICWSTSADPTMADHPIPYSTGGLGDFTCTITGLSPYTDYHVRAYATNASDTRYGDDITFKTLADLSVTTSSVTNYWCDSIICGGEVVSNGGAIIRRGVCWSTSQNPTIANSATNDGSTTGTFTSNIGGLIANTTYYIKAYAINSQDTVYGSQISQTTHPAPSCSTTTVTPMPYSATCGGTVISTGGYTNPERGICWGISSNPTTPRTGTGSPFTVTLTGLDSLTKYYVRAYVKTPNNKIYYGNEISFWTTAYTMFRDDRDGNKYKTVKIGNQTWMAENLNYVTVSGSWCYGDNPSNGNVYGRLYTWDTANAVTPAGWHLPTKTEWDTLFNRVGYNNGSNPNVAYNQLIVGGASGFNAKFGGYRQEASTWYGLGENAYFWSATAHPSISSYAYNIWVYGGTNQAAGTTGENPKVCGMSIRCVKNP